MLFDCVMTETLFYKGKSVVLTESTEKDMDSYFEMLADKIKDSGVDVIEYVNSVGKYEDSDFTDSSAVDSSQINIDTYTDTSQLIADVEENMANWSGDAASTIDTSMNQ